MGMQARLMSQDLRKLSAPSADEHRHVRHFHNTSEDWHYVSKSENTQELAPKV
jgi:hypothetical protein